ncbi:LptA/OstA family protein [Citromicrobium bathyomarinum]|uniref:LptA/OstA family protein n=1 Tax=Citromicrobium bathyomarinum TaxID=72174 RepID=UPI003159D506
MAQRPHKTARPLTRTALRSGMIGFALSACTVAGLQLHAQAIAGHNSNAPVNYAANRIELQDRQNRVVLTGNVKIDQANLHMSSARTIVDYSDAGSLSINRISATGGVTVTRGNESARGNVAVYDFNRRVITMTGDVRLRRGSDTLNGGRLTIDLRSGLSSIDAAGGSGEGGRVTGSFSVPQD